MELRFGGMEISIPPSRIKNKKLVAHHARHLSNHVQLQPTTLPPFTVRRACPCSSTRYGAGKGGIPQVHFYWKLWDNQNMDVIVLSIPIHTHGIRTWMINLISWKWTMCGFGFLFVFQGCKLHNRVWSSSSLISIWKDAHDAPFFQTTFCPSLVQHEWLDFEHYEVTFVLSKMGRFVCKRVHFQKESWNTFKHLSASKEIQPGSGSIRMYQLPTSSQNELKPKNTFQPGAWFFKPW